MCSHLEPAYSIEPWHTGNGNKDNNKLSERSPDVELYKKLGQIGTDIGKLVKKYEKMADTDKALSTFMVGLHSMLNKMGYKEFK